MSPVGLGKQDKSLKEKNRELNVPRETRILSHTPSSDVSPLRTVVGGDESKQERNSLIFALSYKHSRKSRNMCVCKKDRFKKTARLSREMKVARLVCGHNRAFRDRDRPVTL